MNERIQALAKQAEKTYTYKDFSPDGYEVTKQEKTVDLEKFAELIVQECAYINFYKRTDISLKDAYRVSKVILEHFGVEE
jgi:hypothetical protein